MRKKLTCIDISKLLELKKILLEEKFLKISTTFFLIFDPVCISIFNNYISKDVNELYLLLRFVMMFFALFNLFLFTSNEFITFCCKKKEKKDLNNLRDLDIEKYKNLDNFIVVGCCTDICVYQFVLTLKTYFNQNNLDKNIIVPISLVETYDIDEIHSGDMLNTIFLNSMIQNGINVVKEIIL